MRNLVFMFQGLIIALESSVLGQTSSTTIDKTQTEATEPDSISSGPPASTIGYFSNSNIVSSTTTHINPSLAYADTSTSTAALSTTQNGPSYQGSTISESPWSTENDVSEIIESTTTPLSPAFSKPSQEFSIANTPILTTDKTNSMMIYDSEVSSITPTSTFSYSSSFFQRSETDQWTASTDPQFTTGIELTSSSTESISPGVSSVVTSSPDTNSPNQYTASNVLITDSNRISGSPVYTNDLYSSYIAETVSVYPTTFLSSESSSITVSPVSSSTEPEESISTSSAQTSLLNTDTAHYTSSYLPTSALPTADLTMTSLIDENIFTSTATPDPTHPPSLGISSSDSLYVSPTATVTEKSIPEYTDGVMNTDCSGMLISTEEHATESLRADHTMTTRISEILRTTEVHTTGSFSSNDGLTTDSSLKLSSTKKKTTKTSSTIDDLTTDSLGTVPSTEPDITKSFSTKDGLTTISSRTTEQYPTQSLNTGTGLTTKSSEMVRSTEQSKTEGFSTVDFMNKSPGITVEHNTEGVTKDDGITTDSSGMLPRTDEYTTGGFVDRLTMETSEISEENTKEVISTDNVLFTKASEIVMSTGERTSEALRTAHVETTKSSENTEKLTTESFSSGEELATTSSEMVPSTGDGATETFSSIDVLTTKSTETTEQRTTESISTDDGLTKTEMVRYTKEITTESFSTISKLTTESSGVPSTKIRTTESSTADNGRTMESSGEHTAGLLSTNGKFTHSKMTKEPSTESFSAGNELTTRFDGSVPTTGDHVTDSVTADDITSTDSSGMLPSTDESTGNLSTVIRITTKHPGTITLTEGSITESFPTDNGFTTDSSGMVPSTEDHTGDFSTNDRITTKFISTITPTDRGITEGFTTGDEFTTDSSGMVPSTEEHIGVFSTNDKMTTRYLSTVKPTDGGITEGFTTDDGFTTDSSGMVTSTEEYTGVFNTNDRRTTKYLSTIIPTDGGMTEGLTTDDEFTTDSSGMAASTMKHTGDLSTNNRMTTRYTRTIASTEESITEGFTTDDGYTTDSSGMVPTKEYTKGLLTTDSTDSSGMLYSTDDPVSESYSTKDMTSQTTNVTSTPTTATIVVTTVVDKTTNTQTPNLTYSTGLPETSGSQEINTVTTQKRTITASPVNSTTVLHVSGPITGATSAYNNSFTDDSMTRELTTEKESFPANSSTDPSTANLPDITTTDATHRPISELWTTLSQSIIQTDTSVNQSTPQHTEAITSGQPVSITEGSYSESSSSAAIRITGDTSIYSSSPATSVTSTTTTLTTEHTAKLTGVSKEVTNEQLNTTFSPDGTSSTADHNVTETSPTLSPLTTQGKPSINTISVTTGSISSKFTDSASSNTGFSRASSTIRQETSDPTGGEILTTEQTTTFIDVTTSEAELSTLHSTTEYTTHAVTVELTAAQSTRATQPSSTDLQTENTTSRSTGTASTFSTSDVTTTTHESTDISLRSTRSSVTEANSTSIQTGGVTGSTTTTDFETGPAETVSAAGSSSVLTSEAYTSTITDTISTSASTSRMTTKVPPGITSDSTELKTTETSLHTTYQTGDMATEMTLSTFVSSTTEKVEISSQTETTVPSTAERTTQVSTDGKTTTRLLSEPSTVIFTTATFSEGTTKAEAVSTTSGVQSSIIPTTELTSSAAPSTRESLSSSLRTDALTEPALSTSPVQETTSVTLSPEQDQQQVTIRVRPLWFDDVNSEAFRMSMQAGLRNAYILAKPTATKLRRRRKRQIIPSVPNPDNITAVITGIRRNADNTVNVDFYVTAYNGTVQDASYVTSRFGRLTNSYLSAVIGREVTNSVAPLRVKATEVPGTGEEFPVWLIVVIVIVGVLIIGSCIIVMMCLMQGRFGPKRKSIDISGEKGIIPLKMKELKDGAKVQPSPITRLPQDRRVTSQQTILDPEDGGDIPLHRVDTPRALPPRPTEPHEHTSFRKTASRRGLAYVNKGYERDIDDDGLVNQHQVSPPSKRGRHKVQRTVTPPVCSEIRVLDPNRPLIATSSSASEENMMDGQYHEAAVFEHVAKMSRLADSPRKKPSLLQVRHRSSVQPLNDLSSLPPVQKTPLVGPSPTGVPSSGMETDQGPKSPEIVHEKPEDVEKTLRERAEKERLRNKQRQREIIKEKENQALAAQQDGADPQQSKKDWSKVQSEIEAVLGVPEELQDQLKPTPVAKKRQEARALRWKKQPRPGSVEEDVNKRVGRNMRAVPRSSQSEPTSPSHKVPSPDRHKALTEGIVADRADGPVQLVSYTHYEENLLKKMTQQMRDRQRVRDSHRAHQRTWGTAPPGGRYTASEPAGSHGASPSASQVGSGPDSMPPHASTGQSALERLFNKGTASGVYHTGAPPSGHHPHQATSAWTEPPGGDVENQKAIASQIVKSLSPEDRLALAKQLIQDLQAVH